MKNQMSVFKEETFVSEQIIELLFATRLAELSRPPETTRAESYKRLVESFKNFSEKLTRPG